eukprot:3951255-Pleurochrysis_carterae.AAC.1
MHTHSSPHLPFPRLVASPRAHDTRGLCLSSGLRGDHQRAVAHRLLRLGAESRARPRLGGSGGRALARAPFEAALALQPKVHSARPRLQAQLVLLRERADTAVALYAVRGTAAAQGDGARAAVAAPDAERG